MRLTKNHFILFILFLSLNCKKWDYDRIGFTRVITVGSIDVGSNSAFLIGDIEDIRMSRIVENGFVLSSTAKEDARLRLDQTDVIQLRSSGLDSISDNRAFAARSSGLASSTTYFFRAYIKIEGGDQTIYGNIDLFTTANLSIFLKSIERSSDDCTTTALIEIVVDGYVPDGETELGVRWVDELYIGVPSDLPGNTISEKIPGSAPNSFLFHLPVQCDKEYTLTAFASYRSASTYTELRSFSTRVGGLWLPKSNFPGNRREFPLSFSIDREVYIGLGKEPRQRFLERFHFLDFWTYSATDDHWLMIGDFEEGNTLGIGVAANGTGYFGTGQQTAESCLTFIGGVPIDGFCLGSGWRTETCANICDCSSKDFFEFNPISQSWVKLELSDSIQFYRFGATAINIGENIYFGLGNRSQGCSFGWEYQSTSYSDLWEFNPKTLEWLQMQSFPGEGRIKAVAYSADDKGYFGLGDYYRPIYSIAPKETSSGGFDLGTPGKGVEIGSLKDFYEFDPSQPDGSQWRTLQSFPKEIAYAKSFALGDIGYVLVNEEYVFEGNVELWKFDRNEGTLGTWAQVQDNTLSDIKGLPQAALSIGNVALVYFAGPQQNFWMYVPELD